MATVRWVGKAANITQVSTITVGAGAWVTGETITITINNVELILTVGAIVTTTGIAQALSQAFNDVSRDGDLIGSESRNVGGQELPEFAEISATYSGSVVSLEGRAAGRPFTVATTTDSGAGTVADATATAATGQNHWNNIDNWNSGAAPNSNDAIVFDDGNVSCLYALITTIQPASLTITARYTGRIGLPERNRDTAGREYDEYRDTYLTFADVDPIPSNTAIRIGEGEGAGSSLIRLDLEIIETTIDVYKTGQRFDPGFPALCIRDSGVGITTGAINVMGGDVGFAAVAGEQFVPASIVFGRPGAAKSDAQLLLGPGVDMSGATYTQLGGETIARATGGMTTATILGGLLTTLDGAHTTINVDGGKLDYRSDGTITTLSTGAGAETTFANDGRSKTVTNASVSAGAILRDPAKTVAWSNGIDLMGCGFEDVVLDIGTHLTIVFSTI